MQLELIDIFVDFARVESVWTSLAAVSGCSYFLSWGWIENWISSLPPQVSVKLAVFSEAGEPVCAFFLGQANITKQKIFRSKAYLLNQTGKWEYDRLYIERNSVLCRPHAVLSLQQIIEMLPGKWEELYLSALDPSCFPGNALSGISEPNRLMIARELPCPYVDLQRVRDKSGDYPSLLGSNIRSQIRRSYRLYEEQGPIMTEIAQDHRSASSIYEELIELHQASWAKRKQDGAFATPYFRGFHQRLIEGRFQSGEIQLIRVRSGQSTIGCLYNFVFRGTVYFYQSGLAAAADNRLKPGYICHAEAVKINAKAGCTAYDFLAGADEYKQRLATDQRSMIWARVQKPFLKFRIERVLRRTAIEGLARYEKWKQGRRRNPPKPVRSEA